MYKSPSRVVAPMLFLALALPTTVLAQAADTANLNGVVLDASGQPVAGYPMKLVTPQWGEVIMHPTEDDGTFTVTGVPPGDYELRVFEPGGSTVQPVVSKQVKVAAGQAERIEIRLGAAKPAAATTLGTTSSGNWRLLVGAAVLLAAALLVFFAVRNRRGAGDRAQGS